MGSDTIKAIIGRWGRNIRATQEATGTRIYPRSMPVHSRSWAPPARSQSRSPCAKTLHSARSRTSSSSACAMPSTLSTAPTFRTSERCRIRRDASWTLPGVGRLSNWRDRARRLPTPGRRSLDGSVDFTMIFLIYISSFPSLKFLRSTVLMVALWWKIIRRSHPISFASHTCHLFLSSSLPPSSALPPSQLALPSQGEVDPWRQDSLEPFLCDFFLPRRSSKERPLSRLDVHDSSSSSSRRLLLRSSLPSSSSQRRVRCVASR